MLKYSDKLDKYVKTIIPLLVLTKEYKVIGSYGRTKYITDIDITNYVQKDMNFKNRLNDIINKLPENIKLFTITTGFDKDFELPWEIINEHKIINYNYYKSINFINELFFNHKITEKERDYCNELLNEKPIIEHIILIEDLLYQKSKIKWNIHDIKKDQKDINNIKTNLDQSIKGNDYNIIHYIIEYDDDFIPVDVALKKKNADINKKESSKFDKINYLMFVKKEYYFILATMKKYFYGKKELKEIEYLLYDKYGWFRQILMNIFYLIQFLEYPIYNDEKFIKSYKKVINKIKMIDYFQNNKLLDKLESNINNKEKFRLLLKKLETNITLYLNNLFKPYANKYYLLIPNKNLKYANMVFS